MQRKQSAQLGFTLIELMIVVAIVGILVAVALPMYWDAKNKANKVEALIQLDKIKKGAIDEYNANSRFPQQAAVTTPGVDCCTQNFGGKSKCAVVAADWDLPEWRALGFRMTDPFLFQYSYTPSNAGASFEATAVGHKTCNGPQITYTLDGQSSGGAPQFTVTEPAN